MIMKNLAIPLLLSVLVLQSCANNSEYSENKMFSEISQDEGYVDDMEEASSLVDNEQSLKDVNKNGKTVNTDDLKSDNIYNTKIIRNADLKFKVDDVKKSSAKIANLVDMNGGYVSSEDLVANKSHYQTIERTDAFEVTEYEINTSNIIYIRVPSKNFQPLMASMKGLSLSEDYVKINAQDVTEEYFDLETRLKTKKEVEARYIDILKKNAKTLDEILLAEDKIRVIREEIEAVEGRLKFLQNKVSLSTIQVEIYQDPFFVKETTKFKQFEKTGWSFGEKAGNALSTGWDGILIFLIGLLYFWPLFLLGGIALWIIRRRIKKKKK
jgi:hypothetical protein